MNRDIDQKTEAFKAVGSVEETIDLPTSGEVASTESPKLQFTAWLVVAALVLALAIVGWISWSAFVSPPGEEPYDHFADYIADPVGPVTVAEANAVRLPPNYVVAKEFFTDAELASAPTSILAMTPAITTEIYALEAKGDTVEQRRSYIQADESVLLSIQWLSERPSEEDWNDRMIKVVIKLPEVDATNIIEPWRPGRAHLSYWGLEVAENPVTFFVDPSLIKTLKEAG